MPGLFKSETKTAPAGEDSRAHNVGAYMKHGSLFSGIGGFDLAAEWMGWNNVFQVEIDGFCQKVLQKNFPDAKRYGDIRQFDGTSYRGTIDVLSGGFPCKQTSVAAAIHGKRTGLSGYDSSLWYEELRVINEVHPDWATIENVSGIRKWESVIQKGLEGIGYTVSRLEQKAAYYGLPHRRQRYIYVANCDGKRLEIPRQTESPTIEWYERLAASGGPWLQSTPRTSGGINGIPNRLDRIKSLGNAVVPAVVFQIFKAIEAYETNHLRVSSKQK